MEILKYATVIAEQFNCDYKIYIQVGILIYSNRVTSLKLRDTYTSLCNCTKTMVVSALHACHNFVTIKMCNLIHENVIACAYSENDTFLHKITKKFAQLNRYEIS